jgi:hypothetical protein
MSALQPILAKSSCQPTYLIYLGGEKKHRPPSHYEGWMISGQKTVFYWFSVPFLKTGCFFKTALNGCCASGFCCRGGSARACSPEGGTPRNVPKPRENARAWELPLNKQLSFYFLTSCPFHRKEFHGNVGTYKNGGSSPSITPQGCSAGVDPSKYT